VELYLYSPNTTSKYRDNSYFALSLISSTVRKGSVMTKEYADDPQRTIWGRLNIKVKVKVKVVPVF
jgi:hypothetical protein